MTTAVILDFARHANNEKVYDQNSTTVVQQEERFFF